MKNVLMYKAEPCGYCRAALRFLRDVKGVSVEIIDLTGDHKARMSLIKKTGRRTVPQIFVGETHVGGYDELRALDVKGELDLLFEKNEIRRM